MMTITAVDCLSTSYSFFWPAWGPTVESLRLAGGKELLTQCPASHLDAPPT